MESNFERRTILLLGLLLALAATGFAWLRSEGLSLALAAEPGVTVAHLQEYDWWEDAEVLWEARCAGCHVTLDYVPEVFAAEGGREYLIDLMLFGARGEAYLYGEWQSLRHRPYGEFDDEQIAGLLNLMLLAWGNDEALPEGTQLYEAQEVAAARPREVPQDEVLSGRPDLSR